MLAGKLFSKPPQMGRRPSGSSFFPKGFKKFGGKSDWDFDGVPNKFDCAPRNMLRTVFKPVYGGSTDMTAAKRFGPRNISRMPYLGQGRDRKVYALDTDKVLKVAKNPIGLKQNIPERDLEYLDQLKHYETGKDYVVMQRAEPPGSAVTNMFRRLRRRNVKGYGEKKPEYSQAFEEAKVETGFLDYDLAMGDFMAKRNWGEVEGEPVLIDAGTLDKKNLNAFRWERGPMVGLSPSPDSTEEWSEIQHERRAVRPKDRHQSKSKELREVW